MFVVLRDMDADQIYKNLGNRIRSLRKSLGWTQDRLAKAVGISRASLANIEAGRQQVLVHHIFAVAEALNLESPAQLLIVPESDSVSGMTATELPLSGEGLTDKQRREVLNLVGGVLENSDINPEREGA